MFDGGVVVRSKKVVFWGQKKVWNPHQPINIYPASHASTAQCQSALLLLARSQLTPTGWGLLVPFTQTLIQDPTQFTIFIGCLIPTTC